MTKLLHKETLKHILLHELDFYAFLFSKLYKSTLFA